MKKFARLFILLSTVSGMAHANLYQCTGTDETPKLIEEAETKTVSLSKTKPHFNSIALEAETHSLTAAPFLIYYAIDSAEPFMQLSVKYEIARLKQACEASDSVNFVVLLNSLYVEKNEIIICKDKNYRHLNLNKIPDLDASLKIKREHLRTGDHTRWDFGPMNYLVQYKAHINEVFAQFPLAHPDFLFDLISYVVDENGPFPKNKYMPFLNLKSHGSKQNVLSGLHPCQVQAKTKTQQFVMKKLLSQEEIEFVRTADFSTSLSKVEVILEKIALGSSIGVGDKTGLGHAHLGEKGSAFLGHAHLSSIIGLGSSNDLGADNSFGVYHGALTAVLGHLFNEETNSKLGFVMLESCDTNRNMNFHNYSLDNVLGTYSAKNSLWYRNLNWWSILDQANGSTLKLVELLKVHTSEIGNIELK